MATQALWSAPGQDETLSDQGPSGVQGAFKKSTVEVALEPNKPSPAYKRWHPIMSTMGPLIFTAAYSVHVINRPYIKDKVRPLSEGDAGYGFNDTITDIGGGVWYILPTLAYMGIYYSVPTQWQEDLGLRLANYHHESIVLLTRTLLWGGFMVNVVLKPTVGRARPYVQENRREFRPFSYAGSSDYKSFPSGHTLTTFAIAAVAARRYGYEWAILPVAGYAAYTRVLLNRHYFTDVFFSAVMTLTIVNILDSEYWQRNRPMKFFPDMQIEYHGAEPIRKDRAGYGLDVVYYLTFIKTDLDYLRKIISQNYTRGSG